MSDRRHVFYGVILLVIGVAFIVIGLSACSASLKVTNTDPTSGTPTPTAAGRTVVTAKVKSLPIFSKPFDAHPVQRLDHPNADGAPLVFLTKGQQAGWYHVLLPVPPNGSTGWVRASDVVPSSTQFRVEVRTRGHQLLVYRGGQRLLATKAGIGTKDTPTPGGEYFITELIKTPDPGGPYGPYAYGISGQSTVLKSFNGGPPVIGIHGTNDPAKLGHDVSHGCVRVDNVAITKLAKLLPLGTPVDIIDG